MMTFEQLTALAARLTRQGGPSFYRRLYGLTDEQALRVDSWDEWRALPFVTKAALLESSFRERLFTPHSSVDHIRSTSGTSGKPPLYCPRTPLRHMEYRFDYHDFAGGILAYHTPIAPYVHEAWQRERGIEPRVVTLDPKHPEASARLARLSGVDSMSLFAFHVPLIAEHLQREGVAQRIKLIEICGERCSAALFSYMREVFPQATVIPFYGASEVEDSPIGMPCRAITDTEPMALYHAKSSHYHELIDEKGAYIEPTEGAEGELILTAYPGEPSAFPLLRYRTGDRVRVVDKHCAKHGSWSFTVLGRVDMDFVKIIGGMLRVDEIERVVRSLGQRIRGDYAVQYEERATAQGPKPELTLLLYGETDADVVSLGTDFAAQLRLAPELTYAEGVRRGLFLPLTCVRQGAPPGKRKRIVRRA